MTINIVDAGCGIGKTTALINKINGDTSDQKYIFITPFLSEVERIKTSCPAKAFVDPQDNDGRASKLKSLLRLFEEGRNIATTHALFKRFNSPVLEAMKEKHYILVMDEVADVIEELPISKSDLKILVEKYMYIHPRTRIVEWTDNDYDGKFNDYMRLIKMSNVFAYLNEKTGDVLSLIWLFPYRIFEAFKEVYILTYMFDGQIQKKYFDYYNSKYEHWFVKDFTLTLEKQTYDYSKEKSKITVCKKEPLNKVGEKETALSKSWFERNKSTERMKELQNNMRRFFRTQAKVDSSKLLWTTFKQYEKTLRRKGFIGGFAPINSRATNMYSNKTAIAYVGNRYFKPTIKNFFTFNGIDIGGPFEDSFALSELVQFVYRSAIRNGEAIEVYIPSKRMRTLFINWLKEKDE